MAKKDKSGFEPFKGSQRSNACELLAKAAIALEKARQHVKECKEQFDKLRDAIQRGGYLNEAQLELGEKRGHPDDVLDEPEDGGDAIAAAREQAKKARNGAAARE